MTHDDTRGRRMTFADTTWDAQTAFDVTIEGPVVL
jgi:hypothetical protein